MLESLILTVIVTIGIISLLFSVGTFLVGFMKKSKRTKNRGLRFLIIPIFCFGLIFFWFKSIIPCFNNHVMKEFSGEYYSKNLRSKEFLNMNMLTQKNYSLKLKENGTYQCDSISGVRLWKSGNWESGGIDGAFYFYNNNESLKAIVYPTNHKGFYRLKFDYNSQNKELTIPSTITFIKRTLE